MLTLQPVVQSMMLKFSLCKWQSSKWQAVSTNVHVHIFAKMLSIPLAEANRTWSHDQI